MVEPVSALSPRSVNPRMAVGRCWASARSAGRRPHGEPALLCQHGRRMVLALTSLQAARIQMAVSLGFHIVFAALGVGLPLLLLIAEYRANRNGDDTWMTLARRWAKALG